MHCFSLQITFFFYSPSRQQFSRWAMLHWLIFFFFKKTLIIDFICESLLDKGKEEGDRAERMKERKNADLANIVENRPLHQ